MALLFPGAGDPTLIWPRVRGQLQRLLIAQPEAVVEPPDWQVTRQVNFLYRRQVVLVLDEDYDTAATRLPGHTVTDLHGFKRLTLTGPASVPGLVAGVNASVGRRVVAPDHVLHVAGWSICPAVEPFELPLLELGGVPVPLPPVAPAQGKQRDVAVVLVDTGLSPASAAAASWMSGVTGDAENSWSDGSESTGEPSGYINVYAGHGTFAAGIVAAAAPDVTVHVVGGLDPKLGAAAFESDIVNDLATVLSARKPPNVILVNAGFTVDDPLGLAALVAEELAPAAAPVSPRSPVRIPPVDPDEPATMRLLGGIVAGLTDTVVVCPAGNYGSSRKFWPAAARWAVGVGGLDEAQQRLCGWSNWGDWVDVYARGVHTNAFLSGKYLTLEPGSPQGETRDFRGAAVWAGTSFAAPVVAAAIAQQAAVTGTTTVAAWRAIAATAAAAADRHEGWPTVATATEESKFLP